MDENELFRQATLAICGQLEIEKALCACMRVLSQEIPADTAWLELYDFELGVMRVVARATVEGGERSDVVVPVPEEGMRDAEGIDSSDVLIINDPDRSPVARAMNNAFEEQGATCLAMPLAIDAMPVGVLVLTRRSGEPFLPAHGRLLGLLNEPVAVALTNSLRHDELLALQRRLANDNRFLQDELRHVSGDQIVGARFGLQDVMRRVQRVARLDSPVLLLGETGVGKDVIANAIHQESERRSGPFIKVNSGAIPDTLIDSELFGHERGAFTGADARKRGRFERAHGGTLFLDEIGELPPAAQVRLLRVLQHGEIERVGGSRAVDVDVRIITATHRDLEAMVAEGRFREDLWFRINVFPIRIPPLRHRTDDIRALVQHFVTHKSRELKLGPPPPIARGALEPLLAYGWPGNVRELANVVERALILGQGAPMTFEPLLPMGATGSSRPEPLASTADGEDEDDVLETLDEATAHHIRRALRRTGGKIHGPGGAAELLGLKANTLRYRMDKLGVAYRKKR